MEYFVLGWTIVNGELITESHTFRAYEDAAEWCSICQMTCRIIGPVKDMAKHLMYAQEVRDELVKTV